MMDYGTWRYRNIMNAAMELAHTRRPQVFNGSNSITEILRRNACESLTAEEVDLLNQLVEEYAR